jgi:hypothetical protein
MHFPAFVLSLVTVILLCVQVVAALAEDYPEAGIQKDTPRKYSNISFVEPESKISEPALVPLQLALAAEQVRCNYKDDIKELPIQLIQTDGRRIALVFCRSGVGGSHHVFDFADLRRPKLVELPFLAQKAGFGSTPRPGLLTWKRDAGVFEAVSGSDMCSSLEIRHTYRLGVTEGWVSQAASFVVVRVEARDNYCSGHSGDWVTVWEAPPWPTSVAVR